MPQKPLYKSNSKHILIGEDDLDDQEFLKEIFSSIDSSYQLSFLTSGAEILSYLDQCPGENLPCLLLLDYNMPGINGVEVLKELKKTDRYNDVPKIVWSTSQSDKYKSLCLESGAHDYLVKPSNVNDLIEICRYMLSSCVS